jgi:hypothetical protein
LTEIEFEPLIHLYKTRDEVIRSVSHTVS